MHAQGSLVQIVVLVAMAHGFRALGKRVGPSWGGLLLGLPSTTALVLVGCGVERGLDEATVTAEACLAGLVAAAVLPLIYARAAGAGFGMMAAAVAAVLGYLAVASGLWWIPDPGPSGRVVVAAVGLLAACRMARRPLELPPRSRSGPGLVAGQPLPRAWGMASRTLVPAVYVVVIRLLRVVAGSSGSGRFITFPGTSLAVLILTHLEAGPATACRTAAAMPVGGLGMFAFLTTFRFACPSVGLAWGTALGFALALATLATAGTLVRPIRAGAGSRIARVRSGSTAPSGWSDAGRVPANSRLESRSCPAWPEFLESVNGRCAKRTLMKYKTAARGRVPRAACGI